MLQRHSGRSAGAAQTLIASLDEILTAMPGEHHKVAVKGKLLGIGAESYTSVMNSFVEN